MTIATILLAAVVGADDISLAELRDLKVKYMNAMPIGSTDRAECADRFLKGTHTAFAEKSDPPIMPAILACLFVLVVAGVVAGSILYSMTEEQFVTKIAEAKAYRRRRR